MHQLKMESEMKAFQDTKAGVKGLVDAGVVKIPPLFIRPPDEQLTNSNSNKTHLKIPVINLEDVAIRRKEIVEEILDASETWGFFQLVNHGIPLSVLEEMIEGGRRFHEQDTQVKKGFYTLDTTRKVRLQSNVYQSRSPMWNDTLYFSMAPDPPQPEELPQLCRDIVINYTKHVTKLGEFVFELLSEALGLKPDHLKDMECAESRTLICQYYPVCPEPELTVGSEPHTDPVFLTILLQDNVGGLQILHQRQWVDVHPVPGALLVNIGDLLQLISNDKLKSVEHKVLVNKMKPRTSVPFFFCSRPDSLTKCYGPTKELLSEENPPIYRETLLSDFLAIVRSKVHKANGNLAYLKL